MKTSFLHPIVARRAGLLALAAFCLVALSALTAAPLLDLDHPKIKEAVGLQNAMTPGLIKVEGILGTATGLDENGNVSIVIYVNKNSQMAPQIVAGMPKGVKNVPISARLTEPFHAYPGNGKSGGGGGVKPVSHTAKQTPPIQLGTSGGWGKGRMTKFFG